MWLGPPPRQIMITDFAARRALLGVVAAAAPARARRRSGSANAPSPNPPSRRKAAPRYPIAIFPARMAIEKRQHKSSSAHSQTDFRIGSSVLLQTKVHVV